MAESTAVIPAERIERCILVVRGHKVMLDTELAELYGVPTKALVQAVKRNAARFPSDFAFPLTNQEFTILRSQIVTSSSGWGGRRTPPLVFTELGVAMLSTVLNSERAIQVNVQIMRTFVKLRTTLASHEDLRRKIQQLESKYDEKFKEVFEAIQMLMEPPAKPKKPIGFGR